jgi:glycosyltransferase involved in cell wall biosynthesis
MKKLLVLTAKKISPWASCQVISSNLHKVYSKLPRDKFDVQFFPIDQNFVKNGNADEILLLSNKIAEYRPDEMVFLDHLPHPMEVLSFLRYFTRKEKFPTLVFHVYGDFTFYAHDWIKLGEFIEGSKSRLIVASDSQRKLLDYFLTDSQTLYKYLFPVNSLEYYFDEDERDRFRFENNIGKSDKVVLYSGRISLQKNVDILISEFVKIYKQSTSPLKLWIVGSFDDLGAPFQGVFTRDGYMFSKIQGIMDKLPDDIKSSIRFFGHQKKSDLRRIKNAADLFISLSLYHDEDYGMSPAEALSCGLPCLLTDWGGYSSFPSAKWNAQLIDVKLTEFGHEINTPQLGFLFNELILLNINNNDRKKWSTAFLEEFSIEGSVNKLATIFENEARLFKGFNFNLNQLSSSYWCPRPFIELNKKLSPSDTNFYSKVYSNYISKHFSGGLDDSNK